MDGNVATPAVVEPVTPAVVPTPEDLALDVIVGVGKEKTGTATPEPEVQPAEPVAPAPTPTDPPTAEVTPAPQPSTPPTDGAKPPIDPASGSAEGESAQEPPPLDEAQAFADALGLPAETAETTETLRTKAEGAAREADRVLQERESQFEPLKEMGLEVVHVGEGKYQLSVTDDYREKFDIEKELDIARLIEPLSEGQKEAMITDPEGTFTKISKGLLKKGVLELLAKRPPIKGSVTRPLLTEHETSDVYSKFIGAKRPDGQTLYPDADKPEMQAHMARLWNAGSPAMDAMKDAGMRDKAAYEGAMELCYYKAAYGLSQVKERIRLATESAMTQTEKNKQDVSIPAGGAGAPAGASPAAAPLSAEDAQLDLIAKSKPA